MGIIAGNGSGRRGDRYRSEKPAIFFFDFTKRKRVYRNMVGKRAQGREEVCGKVALYDGSQDSLFTFQDSHQ